MSKSEKYKFKGSNPLAAVRGIEKMSADVEINKSNAWVAYIPFLFWVPLFTCKKGSNFARFCMNQGLLLTIQTIVSALIVFAIYWFAPEAVMGPALAYEVVGGVLLTILVAFCFYGMTSSVDGKFARVPLIGRIKIIKHEIEKPYETLYEQGKRQGVKPKGVNPYKQKKKKRGK